MKYRRILILAVIIASLFFVIREYHTYFGVNVPQDIGENDVVYIGSGLNLNEVAISLEKQGFIKDIDSFVKVAKKMSFDKNPMRSGRFKILPSMSNVDLIRHLRSGKQDPVKLVLTHARLVEDIAGKVASQLEIDSTSLAYLMHDTIILAKLGYSDQTLMSMFIPNTYEVFWNISGIEFLERMLGENKKFWLKQNRLEKAKKRDLSIEEVYTLASIVEKETNFNAEKKRMAGVYLNRIDRGIPLQADPTCVFATRDFYTARVTNYHTTFDSPYNTYLYGGLPPGPIAMSSIASIDAVLDSEDHHYMYFCAFGDGTGRHSFAHSLKEHNINAARYRNNLRKRGRR